MVEKKVCCGCGSCAVACGYSCIQMVMDEEGFFFPYVDKKKCVECGLCEKACPLLNEMPKSEPIECYSVLNKNNEVWKRSTSGGAFSLICDALPNDVWVCAATMDEENNVVHEILPKEDIGCFRKSKYVQSDLKDNFSRIRRLLQDNKSVLFCGTPCQVSALKAYLRRDYDGLITIDLACHGVGSPKIFKEYLREIEKEENKAIKEVAFREKKKKWGSLKEYGFLVVFEDGSKLLRFDDLYNNAFLQSLVVRDSCIGCQYKNIARVGDITLADYKDMFVSLYGRKVEKKNRSTVLLNSEKGQQIFKLIGKENADVLQVSWKQAVYKNWPLQKKMIMDEADQERRKEFFEKYGQGNNLKVLLKKYTRRRKFWEICLECIPEKIRAFIKVRILRRGVV